MDDKGMDDRGIGDKGTLLIVDDDTVYRQRLALALERRGFAVRPAESVATARLDASNSTGSVTTWNSTAAPNTRAPASTRPPAFRKKPSMMSTQLICDPMFAAGTSAVRIAAGA